jgi:hypothetical protein
VALTDFGYLNILATWWRLYKKRVVCNKLDVFVLTMETILESYVSFDGITLREYILNSYLKYNAVLHAMKQNSKHHIWL